VYYVDVADLDKDEKPRVRWQRRDLFNKRQDSPSIVRLSSLADPGVFGELLAARDYEAQERLKSLRELVLGAILDGWYRIPATVMSNDIDLEALTRIFETLNRTGVKLDAFDLMVAVMRPADFLLRQRWEEAQERNGSFKQMKVEGIELLKLIALWQREIDKTGRHRAASKRVLGVRQRDVLNIPVHYVEQRWEDAVNAYARALDFIAEETGVQHANSIPSWAMLLPLAFFLEQRRDMEQIRRWYWRSIAAQSYAQGANTRVTADVDSIEGDGRSAMVLFDIALGDSVKRNRILRLALRGVSRKLLQLDAITGDPLSEDVVEISLAEAAEHKLALPKEEALATLALTSPKSLAIGRASLRVKKSLVLNEEALLSQGFGTTDMTLYPPVDPPRRTLLTEWFEGRVL
jgi:hypothetical protein